MEIIPIRIALVIVMTYNEISNKLVVFAVNNNHF